ncbi:hypothetical protein V8C86DRAFT_2593539 [Haematococcus lacustris]
MARAIDVALVAFFYENGAAATTTATTLAPNLKSELKSLIHCGYQCGVTFEVASVLPIPSNVVAGAEAESCHSLLDSVVVPHQPLECHA